MSETNAIKVRVIRQDGAAALVEWRADEVLRRAIVPAAAAQGGHCAADVLEAGIPYGLPWERLLAPRVSPFLIAKELRQRGIWTFADLQRPGGMDAAQQALLAAYGLDLAALVTAARSASAGQDAR